MVNTTDFEKRLLFLYKMDGGQEYVDMAKRNRSVMNAVTS